MTLIVTQRKKYNRVQIENLEEKKQKLIETIKNIQTPFNDFVEELERLEARKKKLIIKNLKDKMMKHL